MVSCAGGCGRGAAQRLRLGGMPPVPHPLHFLASLYADANSAASLASATSPNRSACGGRPAGTAGVEPEVGGLPALCSRSRQEKSNERSHFQGSKALPAWPCRTAQSPAQPAISRSKGHGEQTEARCSSQHGRACLHERQDKQQRVVEAARLADRHHSLHHRVHCVPQHMCCVALSRAGCRTQGGAAARRAL